MWWYVWVNEPDGAAGHFKSIEEVATFIASYPNGTNFSVKQVEG